MFKPTLEKHFPFPLECMYSKEYPKTKTDFPGDLEAVVRPDPIPNSAVKRCVANGSACIACARVGRRRGLFNTS